MTTPCMRRTAGFILLVCMGLMMNPLQAADAIGTSVREGWVTVELPEFSGALNNPLKGFRDYKEKGYGLLKRQYIKWSEIEAGDGDGVERIIAHTNRITQVRGKRFEDLNIKLVPRVYLDWNGVISQEKGPQQHWPADLYGFDYDSPAFHERLARLVEKLGQAWDNDPRIFSVQMGLIGHFGEHHHPAPTARQRRLLAAAFQKAFKHKPVLVRHTDPEFMEAGFGIYYDTFANLHREPESGPQDQFPWQATHVFREIWKRAPVEGEVEYNWQKSQENARPLESFGLTPDETLRVPAYRRYMIGKIRRYHASYLGWIDDYNEADPEVLTGAAELQKAFGYRFVPSSASYPLTLDAGGKLTVKLSVKNTGSAPFYLDWPVAAGLFDPVSKKPVWSAPLTGMNLRTWLPGGDWDEAAGTWRRPAVTHQAEGQATLPADFKKGSYILALAILDRQGGMVPSVRFATSHYFQGGWHPLGMMGVGQVPAVAALKDVAFDNPAFDRSLHYKVPAALRQVVAPPLPQVQAVTPWKPDPHKELINPWRYWNLETGGQNLEKEILDGPGRVMRVSGDFGQNATLGYDFGEGVKLEAGHYQFVCRLRGTPGLMVDFELADDWRKVSQEASLSLTEDWQEHRVKFTVKTMFKDKTTLRFRLPRQVKGTFELTDPRLRLVE